MKTTPAYIYYFLIAQIHFTYGSRILGIFPFPAKSHFTFNNAIMKSLIEAGHEVTVITSFPEQASLENYTSIIDTSKDEVIHLSQPFTTVFARSAFEIMGSAMNTEKPFCYKMMNLPEIQLMLNSKEKLYDVIFVEIMILYKCFLPVAAKMNIPVIGTETFKTKQNVDYIIGNPNHPAYILFEGVPNTWGLDTFIGRFKNVWNYIQVILYQYLFVDPCLEKFHQDHSKQLASLRNYIDIEPSLIFYNNHPSILSRPLVPNAIEIGGIHMKQAKPLPKNIKKFIDEATHGVILFSMGSLVKAATMPAKTANAFREAFAEIPQRVIWKFESQMENLSDNVMLLDWLPQRDILEHENVKAFISHCGQGGMNEAIYSATPLVTCAVFGDQLNNANILRKMQVAVQLDITNISKEDILTALNTIINDTKYINNMKKLSNIFKDRPMTPQQSVVYWTDYIIRHNGASHLKVASLQLSWFQYLLLDVIIFIVSIFIIFSSLVYYFVKFFLKYCYIRCQSIYIFRSICKQNCKNKNL